MRKRTPGQVLSAIACTKAFTLMELLVTIALAGTLAALLFSVLGRMKTNGNQMKCLVNLRQIGVAFGQYSAENDGKVVKARDYSGWVNGPDGGWPESWVSNLNPYLMGGEKYDGTSATTSRVFQCPDGKKAEWNSVSYLANIFLGGFRDPELGVRLGLSEIYNPRRMTTSSYPSKCVIVADGNPVKQGFLEFEIWNKAALDQLDARHDEAANLLFADGHVESCRIALLSEQQVVEYFTWNGLQWWPASN